MQWPKSGRYQKLARLDAAKVLRGCLPILALFTAACAGGRATTRNGGKRRSRGLFTTRRTDARFPLESPAPDNGGFLPLTVQTPALAAVIASREAMKRLRPFSLQAIVPFAGVTLWRKKLYCRVLQRWKQL